MERSKLEKLIKKLEILDLREWKYNDCILTAEVGGMIFKIYGGSRYVTGLAIKNVGSNSEFEEKERFESKETKPLKKALENLYKKTYGSLGSLLEYEKKQLTEKINNFLLE